MVASFPFFFQVFLIWLSSHIYVPVFYFQLQREVTYLLFSHGTLRKYGFQRYLQHLFTCPEPVMRYLCLMYHVHRIPVGTQHIKGNTEWISQECPELTSYYAPDVQVSVLTLQDHCTQLPVGDIIFNDVFFYFFQHSHSTELYVGDIIFHDIFSIFCFQYSVKRSKYSNNVSHRNTALK